MTTLHFEFTGLPILGMSITGKTLPDMTPEQISDVEQHVSKTLAPKWGRTPRTVSETGPELLGGAA